MQSVTFVFINRKMWSKNIQRKIHIDIDRKIKQKKWKELKWNRSVECLKSKCMFENTFGFYEFFNIRPKQKKYEYRKEYKDVIRNVF